MPARMPDLRGRYDRSLSRTARGLRHRELIFEGAAIALDEVGAGAVTVERILEKANVGRNTFYAHFDDLHDLLGGVREWALDVLFEAVDARTALARTPLERLRALAEAWLAAVEMYPVLARTSLSHVVGADPYHVGSRARERLRDRLVRAARYAQVDGLLSSMPSEATLAAITGAFIGVGLAMVDPRRPAPPDARSALSEIAVRSFR